MLALDSVLLAAALALQPPAAADAARPPNILFVFSDDHAAHAISAYGSRINTTPHLDRLAAEGALFGNCSCGNSICGPSRATILTGLHSHANGFMRNGNRFDGDQTTFPKLLRAAGYRTAIFGKWHLTSDPQGFDEWKVLPGQGNYYNPDFRTAAGRERIHGYCTDVTTDLALDFLNRHAAGDRPFLLMCQHKAPHRSWMPGPDELDLYRDVVIPEPETLFDDYTGRGPAAAAQEMQIDRHMYLYYDLKLTPAEGEELTGPDPAWRDVLDRMDAEQRARWDAAFAAENAAFTADPPTGAALVRWKYQRYIKNYLRCVAGVDKSVGRLLAWLDDHPAVKANTVVVYSSDQGFYLGDNGWYDKRWMYEPSLRMPLLLRWPGRVEAGSRIDALVQNIDFGPSFLAMAGIAAPAGMHGRSFLPLLEGGGDVPWRDAVYYHYYESHAVHMVAAHYGVRTARYKLMYFYEPEYRYHELYDLQRDPTERRSVWDDPDYAGVREALAARLEELRRQYGDDTGVLDGAFDVTAGVARLAPSGDGYVMRANAWGGYALRTLPAPITGSRTLTVEVAVADGAAPAEAMVIVASGSPRDRLLRIGCDLAHRRLVARGPEGMQETASADLPAPVAGRCAVTLRVDLSAHRLVAAAGGAELEVPLPRAWQSITHVGYGASNATVVFGRIQGL